MRDMIIWGFYTWGGHKVSVSTLSDHLSHQHEPSKRYIVIIITIPSFFNDCNHHHNHLNMYRHFKSFSVIFCSHQDKPS